MSQECSRFVREFHEPPGVKRLDAKGGARLKSETLAAQDALENAIHRTTVTWSHFLETHASLKSWERGEQMKREANSFGLH